MKNTKIKFLFLLIIASFIFCFSFVKAEEDHSEEENSITEELILTEEKDIDNSQNSLPQENNKEENEEEKQTAEDVLITEEPVSKIENVIIRYNDTVIYQGEAPLPNVGNIDIEDNKGVVHPVNSQSILGFLYLLGQNSATFSLSNLEYYDAYNSFYLKCITPNNTEELCNNWQYVINGFTPFSSMDSVILEGGESVGIYFGSPHQVVLDKTTLDTGDVLTTQAMKYNYIDNTWYKLIGVTIGATIINPDDPYNPTVVDSHIVDEEGIAIFTFKDIGDYNIGISEDYYFPTYSVKVSQPVSHTSGGSILVEKKTFDVAKALGFIENLQNTDGSFGADMYTDWAGIAISATGNTNQSKLIQYFKSHTPNISNLTDNERRVMALLANGQNPYSFNDINYIQIILDSFDGKQFGDSSMINDDVFALIPLINSGYTYDDFVISQDIDFILSQQSANGSWVNSIDMTAATIQSLKTFDFIPKVSDSLTKAANYLESNQGADGGFGSVYSTSWAIQAMNILGLSWVNNNNTPIDYLANYQSSDGGALLESENSQNRIWSTSYAIPAVVGKSWSQIMQKVGKQEPKEQKEFINIDENLVSVKNDDVQDTKIIDSTIVELENDTTKENIISSNNNIKKIANIKQAVQTESLEKEINNDTNTETLIASVGNTKNNLPKYVTLGGTILLVTIFYSRKFLIKLILNR